MASQRRDRGAGTIYRRANGTYAGQIDLGYDTDGKRRRRTVYGPTKEAVQKKLRTLQRQLEDHGDLPTADITVGKWLDYWLVSIAGKRLKPNTLRSYRTTVNKHLKPIIGKRPLARLSLAHIRAMHDALTDRGLSSTTAMNAHRILSVALNDAVREGRVHRNVAALVPAPAKAASTQTALTSVEAIKVLRHSADTKDPMFSRWAMALLLGARQGECLGLRWPFVDLEDGVIDLSWSLQRVPYTHGCGGDCGKTARSCPSRRVAIAAGLPHELLTSNLVLLTPKSVRSRRVVPLPAPLLAALKRQKENAPANDHGLVWAHEGEPVDPRDDWQAWHDLLDSAKVPTVPLHAARHTTATLLLELKIPEHVVSAILGHSSAVVTRSYQHVDQRLAREALTSLGELLALP